MTEIVEKNDATTPSQDGWLVFYKVRRDDGRLVTVEAHCTGTGEAVARNVGNEESLDYIRDQGSMAAVEYAERAQAPKSGDVVVRLSIHPADGELHALVRVR